MKKILGVLGVAVIAAAMFFSANNVNNFNSDTNLATLINLNVATVHAEPGEGVLKFDPKDCIATNSRGRSVPGTEFCCSAGTEDCTYQDCTEDVIIGGQY